MDIVDAWKYLGSDSHFLANVTEQARKLASCYCVDELETAPIDDQVDRELIILMDALGRVVHMNDALERLTRISLVEARGVDACDLFVLASDREFLRARIQKSNGSTVPYPINVMPRGALMPVICVWTLRRINSSNGIVYFLGRGYPLITEKKKRAHADA